MNASASDARRVALIGATGFTGRLVAGELAGRATPCVLAARNRARLDRLAGEVGGTTAEVDVTDPASLRRLIHPGDAIINCAGPFARLGEPVVRQCIETGAQYMDTSGEQPWMREIHERYHEPARAAGVAVVNGLAFEWTLGDCAVALAAGELDAPLRTVDVLYAWREPATSRGTRRTSLRIAGTRAWQLEDGRWRRRPTGAAWRAFPLASGRSLSGILFGAGEVVTVPRWSEPTTVRGWMAIGHRSARLAPFVAPALPILIRLLRPLLERLATRGDDPTDEDRESNRFTIRVEVEDRNGGRAAVEVRGRDPYGLTARIAVLGAERTLAGGRAGVLAPSQLLEPRALLDSLPVVVERDTRPERSPR